MNVEQTHLIDGSLTVTEGATASAICENLTIEKRFVETGAIRVRKLVHEDLVVVNTPLTSETSRIDRIKMDKVVTGPVSIRYEGDVTIIPILEERSVTYTELVLVEEIRITRRRTEEPSSQEVTLRREEVVIERLDLPSGAWHIIDENSERHKF